MEYMERQDDSFRMTSNVLTSYWEQKRCHEKLELAFTFTSSYLLVTYYITSVSQPSQDC